MYAGHESRLCIQALFPKNVDANHWSYSVSKKPGTIKTIPSSHNFILCLLVSHYSPYFPNRFWSFSWQFSQHCPTHITGGMSCSKRFYLAAELPPRMSHIFRDLVFPYNTGSVTCTYRRWAVVKHPSTSTCLMSPCYTERPLSHNLIYTMDYTFKKFICTCSHSFVYAHGPQFRGGNFNLGW